MTRKIIRLLIFEGENGHLIDMEIRGGVAITEPVYLVYANRGARSSLDCKELELRYINHEQKLQDIKSKKESPPLNIGVHDPEKLNWIEKNIPVEPSSKCQAFHIWYHVYDAMRNGVAFPITIDEGVEVVKYTEMVRKTSEFER